MRFLSGLLSLRRKLKKASYPLPPAWFNAEWYLQQYPDVAAAEMDAWKHFYLHGSHEGRMPCSEHAKMWENQTLPASVRQDLESSLAEVPSLQANYAAWLLGRWHAAQNDWSAVQRYMKAYSPLCEKEQYSRKHRIPTMLKAEALRQLGELNSSTVLLKEWQGREGLSTESILSYANVLQSHAEQQAVDHPVSKWLANVNQLYAGKSLALLLLPDASPPLFDNLQADVKASTASPAENERVSIIIPAYNASTGLKVAVNSLLCQTWPSLEILIVDDASTDDTVHVATKLAQQDSRVRVIKQPYNQGAYAARNVGLREARGDFITVHDSDDWSHPQKIERQVLALRNDPNRAASITHWVRASDSLLFGSWKYPPNWSGWSHRNTSSLMFRRRVFDQLGFWDRVSCSADTEFYHRIMVAYGAKSIIEVDMGTPLAFGRISATSLTQSSATSIFTSISGIRRQYQIAFFAWHAQQTSTADLYVPEAPAVRPFPAPDEMVIRQSQPS